jgi:hypothetical protein
MDEDDDWLEGEATHQGSSSDPIVEQEYQRLATRYSDVSIRIQLFRIGSWNPLRLIISDSEGVYPDCIGWL